MRKFAYKILFAVIIVALFWFVISGDINPFDFLKKNNEPSPTQSEVEKSQNYEDNSLDAIINQSIQDVDLNPMQHLENGEEIKKDPNKEQEGTNVSGSIIDKLKENSDKIDYGIVYNKAEYIKTLSGCEIIANINDEEKIIKLIGIDENECDKDYLSTLMDEYSIIYLEFDAKRYDSKDRSLAYVWTTIPDLKHKDNMINVMLLKSGYAKSVSESPNIKYAYYFMKF